MGCLYSLRKKTIETTFNKLHLKKINRYNLVTILLDIAQTLPNNDDHAISRKKGRVQVYGRGDNKNITVAKATSSNIIININKSI